jgi:hypothetical protein
MALILSLPISAGDGLAGESLYAAWEKAPQYAWNSEKTVWDDAARIGIIGQLCRDRLAAGGSLGSGTEFIPFRPYNERNKFRSTSAQKPSQETATPLYHEEEPQD